MDVRRLREFYDSHRGKATDKWEIYLQTYERLFQPYRAQPVRLLEIGIQNGGSLEIWSEYFAKAQKIVGCDIDPACAGLAYSDPRVSVVIGDANADATRAAVLDRSSQYDIVIDDGSHRSGDIVRSFLNYFPHLEYGGVYVAEDLHCSYWQEYDGGLFDPSSSMSFFKHLADILNHQSWLVPRTRAGLLTGIAARHGCALDEAMLSEVHSVEFVNSVCILRKQPAAQNRLGSRIISGSEELVVPGNRLRSGDVHVQGIQDQSGNPWSIRSVPPGEEVTTLSDRLDQANERISSLESLLKKRADEMLAREDADLQKLEQQRREVERLSQVLEALQASRSWRVTAPLRWISGRLKRGQGQRPGN